MFLYFIIPLYKPILSGSQSYIKYSTILFQCENLGFRFPLSLFFILFLLLFLLAVLGFKPEAPHMAGEHSAPEWLISPASLFWQGSKQPKGLKLVLQPRQALSCNPPGQSLKWGFSIESSIFPFKTYCSDVMNYRIHH